MDDRSADTKAVLYSAILHVGVVGFLFLAMLPCDSYERVFEALHLPSWMNPIACAKPVPNFAGAVIEAELVGVAAAPAPTRASKPKPAPPKPEPPKPEPPKPPEPKPEPPTQPQRNDAVEREKVAELAQQKAEAEQRAQEERHRQEQVLLEQQEREQREREKQLAEIKREHEAALKKLKLEQEKLAQLNDLNKKPVKAPPQQLPESEKPVTGGGGQDNSLEAQYFAAIQNAITNNWLRPDNTQPGVRCMIAISQIIGGDLLDAHVVEPCNADALTRTSIEQAVRRAAPLPYKGYESVFRRDIKFNFHYDG